MNYQSVEEVIKAGYREIHAKYRRDDEIEVTTSNHRRLGAKLKELCASFPHPITALEVGCGTGRHFHSLVNVEELVGIDISEEMLQAAAHPVRQEQISARQIRLIVANAYLHSFPGQSFDLIYSLGMFGNGCPVTAELCNKFYHWLRPGGKLFFNTVDFAGLPFAYRLKRRTRTLIYPLLMPRWRKELDERDARHPVFYLTKRALAEIMTQTQFTRFEISSHTCESPLWRGRHLECIAWKEN